MPQGPEGRGDQSTSLSSSPPRHYTACTYSLCLDKAGQMLQYIAFISWPSSCHLWKMLANLLTSTVKQFVRQKVSYRVVCRHSPGDDMVVRAQRKICTGPNMVRSVWDTIMEISKMLRNPAFIQHVAQVNSKLLYKRLFYSP